MKATRTEFGPADSLSRERVPDGMFAVAPGVWGTRLLLVNAFFIADENETDRWVLVDTGIRGSGSTLRDCARELFGEASKPEAIILTHGHFDHTGAVQELADEWNVPIYAHELEFPYLTGKSSYPPPDPSVGGGMMSRLASLYPNGPINLGPRLRELPGDNSVPGLGTWQWFHTPGHTPGHVSLFRRTDNTLIAGDAFITTNQESAFSVLTQQKQIHGPPAYFTTDWEAAGRSLRTLAALRPYYAGTGHGRPMQGEELAEGLAALSRFFEELAVPKSGRYVDQPSMADRSGVRSVPPVPRGPARNILASIGAGAAILGLAALLGPARRRTARRQGTTRRGAAMPAEHLPRRST
jgi:glyoxylase-like metal-dependent hydrolase (beta-lactamase superfamily II)